MKYTWPVLLLFAGPLWGEPPKLNIPLVVPATSDYVLFVPDTDAVSVVYVSQNGVDPVPSVALADKRMFLLPVRGLPQGSYKFTAVGASKTGEQSQQAFAVVVGTPTPVPPPPGPNPPPPTPDGTSPFPGEGLRVLVVYDAATKDTLPAAQLSAMTSTDVRAYMRAKCPKGPDGITPEFRFWPSTVDASAETKLWQDAFALTKGKALPWVVIGNGKTGYQGPFPANTADFLTLVQKFGG